MRRSIFGLLAVLALAGCASMIDKPYEKVTVLTPGVQGADCQMETPSNKYRVVTPGTVNVERSGDTLDIVCRKPLYYPARLRVESRLRATTLLNAANGVVPGTAYDVANHAVYGYPREIRVELELDPDAVAASKSALGDKPELPRKKERPERAEIPEIEPAKDDNTQMEDVLNRALGK